MLSIVLSETGKSIMHPKSSQLDLADTMHGYMDTMADTGERDYIKFNCTETGESRREGGQERKEVTTQALFSYCIYLHKSLVFFLLISFSKQ
jgi:hypothetical protein